MADEQESVWREFFEKTRGQPPRPLLKQAIRSVKDGADSALDLGSGALNDALFMLELGFDFVTAVDEELVAQEIADTIPPGRFTYVKSKFEDFVFPVAGYDLVNAQFALFFIRPDAFHRVIRDMLGSLKPGGVFCGQLLGDRDQWASDPAMSFVTVEQARALFDGYRIRAFMEEEDFEGGLAVGGTKHWHLFHIIAIAPEA